MRAPQANAIACLTLLAAAGCVAQFDFGGGGKKELPHAVRSDVQYIKCPVCKQLVKQAMRTVKTMREELKPGKKVGQGE